MLILLTGNDTTLIAQKIQFILKKQDIDRYYSVESLQEAILRCLTNSLIDSVTATVLKTTQKDLELDNSTIARLQKSPNLLFIVCENFEEQTKLGRALKPYLISESNLPNTWNKKDIERGIDYYANQFRLNLSYRVKEYLELALNNNFPLLRSGLETLALLSLNPSLELTKEVIPSVHATAIELKEMILACRRGDIPEYLARLKAIAEERVILASLKTQFTILMQTAIGNSQHLSDSDIARLAEINNPKRLYYIRKELTQISLKQLIWLNQQIRDTQYQLKYCNCDLCAKLMVMCCWSSI